MFQGVDESVPRFLRCEDPQVFRRTLQLRDCLLLTDEIWKQRKQEKETYKEPANVRRRSVVRRRMSQARFTPAPAMSKPSVTNWRPFDEFLENFFTQVYGIPRIRLEWAYTYYEAITNHKDYLSLHEVKCIIDNELDENCHWHLFTWLEQAERLISGVATDISEGEETELLVVSRDQLQAVLYELTGAQFESNIESLLEKATMVNGKDMEAQRNENSSQLDKKILIDVKALFFKDPGEEFNPFIRELIALYEGIKLGFVEEVVSKLEKSLDNEAEIKEVSAAQLRDAIYAAYRASRATSDAASAKRELNIIEPARKPDIEVCIEWIMKPSMNEPPVPSIPYEMAVKRLRGSNIFPMTTEG